MRILLTGFEPFVGQSFSPLWEVARALHGLTLAGVQGSAQLPRVLAMYQETIQLP